MPTFVMLNATRIESQMNKSCFYPIIYFNCMGIDILIEKALMLNYFLAFRVGLNCYLPQYLLVNGCHLLLLFLPALVSLLDGLKRIHSIFY